MAFPSPHPADGTTRIALQAFDLYERIGQIHHRPQAAPDNLPAKYVLLYRVLEQLCNELTDTLPMAFDNLFGRLDHVCKEKRMSPSDRYEIQAMRRNCLDVINGNVRPDMDDYRYDLRALLRFVAAVFAVQVPPAWKEELPAGSRSYQASPATWMPYLRVSVTQWENGLLFAATDDAGIPFVKVDYSGAAYLEELLAKDMQLNLLDVQADEKGCLHPGLVIVHPDYLIDISALAACFREYGHHPLNFFINRIKPRASTAPILMGNLAGMFLDDYVNENPDAPVSYARTLRKFFAASALEFCTCELPGDFHEQARRQMDNIRSFVQEVFPRQIEGFDKHNMLLEASFVCERLGLQGRTDMLQKDFKVLVEQKSGKRDEYRHCHKQDHYVQMMLYQGILMYNFGRETQGMRTFLLYSKYPDGLMSEHFDEPLFRESIRLRNCIVANEVRWATQGMTDMPERLDAELLNEYGVTGRLWTHYQKPQLEESIRTLRESDPLARAYFKRFYAFLAKEQLLGKTGGGKEASSGFASLWHMPLSEKLEGGNILLGLTLCEKRKSSPEKGFDLITLNFPERKPEEDFLPNFRTGDIVILYAYTGGKPDVRQHILMKGNIYAITSTQVTVLLRNGQQNKDILGNEGDVFAIEHDSSDISVGNAIRGLYAFLAATPDRRELLLGRRPPRCAPGHVLVGSYGRFDEMILKEKQAEDYFLLVGPPGTGKTSCALRYMVEEALASDAESSLLLLSYTNRAVDEICAMLVDSGIAARVPFIRIGHELSCDKRFTSYLLKETLEDCPRLADIRAKLLHTRIVVGTTTAISSRLYLFRLKSFGMAVIDEASQILEPDLIGILSARHGEKDAIGKFVLIGDYKQLPAITLQSREESLVHDPALQAIGLDDCAHSLFERLYLHSPASCRSILQKQGRMHPAIAEFTNQAFYYREQLEAVPLPHQREELPYDASCPIADGLDRLLQSRRVVFIPVKAPVGASLSEKANRNEARIVAALLERVYRHTAHHFDPNRTVGVIVPYRNQIAMVRKEIAALGLPPLQEISIDTVERYQGSQRDVIIYSFTVRNISQLNFLTSNTFREGEQWIDRKLNVAVTRARKQLFLTGDPAVLGANLTFYKLMEYIRMHNGYIDADVDDFVRGNVEVPAYAAAYDLQTAIYPLSDSFASLFVQHVEKTVQEGGYRVEENDTRYRELLAYGRCTFREESPLSEPDRALLYAYYYMRRQYASATALFETCGSWLVPCLQSLSGSVLFCDCGVEAGASGLAFQDVFGKYVSLQMQYAGVMSVPGLVDLARKFRQSPPYASVPSAFYASLDDLPDSQWGSASRTRLVVFNFSNLFDRITPQEAVQRAVSVNRIVSRHPFHKYVIVYRDDAGNCLNSHSYRAFCSCLLPSLSPLHAEMPYVGSFYYRSDFTGIPPRETFAYEVRTNIYG